MDIEKIRNSIESRANDAFKKTEEVISTSKLNFKISDKKQDIESLYLEIGEKIYEKYEKNETIDTSLIKYCKDIKKIKADITLIESKILKLQDRSICPICGNELSKHDVYCNNCGSKQK
jgi:DNA repair exonuclease SbcCD ATPase subunit